MFRRGRRGTVRLERRFNDVLSSCARRVENRPDLNIQLHTVPRADGALCQDGSVDAGISKRGGAPVIIQPVVKLPRRVIDQHVTRLAGAGQIHATETTVRCRLLAANGEGLLLVAPLDLGLVVAVAGVEALVVGRRESGIYVAASDGVAFLVRELEIVLVLDLANPRAPSSVVNLLGVRVKELDVHLCHGCRHVERGKDRGLELVVGSENSGGVQQDLDLIVGDHVARGLGEGGGSNRNRGYK